MKIVLSLILLWGTSYFSQCNTDVNQFSVGFSDIKANSFTFLDNALDNVTIVGYGEDTHGTAEFTLLAKELMLYLSEKHGFKIFILETSFGEGQYLNDYIQGRNDDLKSIMNKRNQTWRYRTEEFYKLMIDLKEYNQIHEDKILIYGCEMQYILTDISRIKDFLISVNSDYKLEGIDKFNLWENFDETEKVAFFNVYAELKQHFIDNYENFKQKTSEKAVDLAYHQVEILGQFVTTINQNVYQRKHDFREVFMLENIQWILDYEQENSKVLFWAHNQHIGDMLINGTSNSIGHLLKTNYEESYFAIATDFGVGDFVAYPSDANKTGQWYHQVYTIDMVLENTFTNCLKNMGKPNTFLNLRVAKSDSTLKYMLDEPFIQMSGAGAQIRPYQTEKSYIGKEFDAIIYLHETHKINFKD